jgi:lysozyme
MSFFQWLGNLLKKIFGIQTPTPVPISEEPVEKPAPPPVVTPAPTPPRSPTTRIRGVDVSSYQPTTVDWAAVKAAGYDFAIIKASEGETLKDSTFVKHWADARNAGLVCGAYHFFHPLKPWQTQAKNFMDALTRPMAGELPPVLDIEWSDGLQTLGDQGARNALSMLKQMEAFSGLVPWIYTNANFFLNIPTDILPEFKRYPLWISAYVNHEPKLCAPWTTWTAWQYSESENVPGIGKCDVSYFAGSLDDLRAMAKR